MGSRRGLVVSVVSFYLVDLPSNPAKVYSFYSVNLFEKRVKINKKDVWWVVDIVKNQNTLSILDSIPTCLTPREFQIGSRPLKVHAKCVFQWNSVTSF